MYSIRHKVLHTLTITSSLKAPSYFTLVAGYWELAVDWVTKEISLKKHNRLSQFEVESQRSVNQALGSTTKLWPMSESPNDRNLRL